MSKLDDIMKDLQNRDRFTIIVQDNKTNEVDTYDSDCVYVVFNDSSKIDTITTARYVSAKGSTLVKLYLAFIDTVKKFEDEYPALAVIAKLMHDD